MDPEYFDAWINKAVVLNYLQQFVEALEAVDNAVKLDPNDSQKWNSKPQSYHSMRQTQSYSDTP